MNDTFMNPSEPSDESLVRQFIEIRNQLSARGFSTGDLVVWNEWLQPAEDLQHQSQDTTLVPGHRPDAFEDVETCNNTLSNSTYLGGAHFWSELPNTGHYGSMNEQTYGQSAESACGRIGLLLSDEMDYSAMEQQNYDSREHGSLGQAVIAEEDSCFTSYHGPRITFVRYVPGTPDGAPTADDTSSVIPAKKRQWMEQDLSGNWVPHHCQPHKRKRQLPASTMHKANDFSLELGGPCLRCQKLHYRCTSGSNSICRPCQQYIRRTGWSGWALHNRLQNESCFRKFADADPFPLLQQRFDRLKAGPCKRFWLAAENVHPQLYVKEIDTIIQSNCFRNFACTDTRLASCSDVLHVLDTIVQQQGKKSNMIWQEEYRDALRSALAVAELVFAYLCRILWVLRDQRISVRDCTVGIICTIERLITFRRMACEKLGIRQLGIMENAALSLFDKMQTAHQGLQNCCQRLRGKFPQSNFGPLFGLAVDSNGVQMDAEVLLQAVVSGLHSKTKRFRARVEAVKKKGWLSIAFDICVDENLLATPEPNFDNALELKVQIQRDRLNEYKDAEGGSLLHIICESLTSVKDFEAIIEAGCNVDTQDYQGKTALDVACVNGRLKLVEVLLRYKATIKWRAVHSAAQTGAEKILRRLLKTRPGLSNIRGGNGETPLYAACKVRPLRSKLSPSPQCIGLLLEAGADSELSTSEGFTPLQWAICEMVNHRWETWNSSGNVSMRRLLASCSDEKTKACCQRLLNFPPQTLFKSEWAKWLPGWVFGHGESETAWVKRISDSERLYKHR